MDIAVLIWLSSFPAYFPFRAEFELIDGPLQFAFVKSDHILARRGQGILQRCSSAIFLAPYIAPPCEMSPKQPP